MRGDRDPTQRTVDILKIVKERGEISAVDLANELGISNAILRMSICNCTLVDGSRLYEYNKDNKLILGWLED